MENLLKEILTKIELKMSTIKESMIDKFNVIRTGSANPKILDKITVNYYGAEMVLKNISKINVVDGNQIHIKPFDHVLISEIEKAIFNSNLGITPQNDGTIIKLLFPHLTEEKRKALTKEVEKIKEQTKVFIRNIRRKWNEEIKKMKLNEAFEKLFLKEIQNLNNKYIELIEKETKQKNNELLKI
ncbi:MAG: ribosome recycling factor [Candidatus Phytoplasma stylosanthis]|uniref:ribosome recycling factor n=1 Tax=Candidatus Phytoplasma stylosanthis TaxID=2798314 RepID=UPI0029395998|nr:ribosome recycling factor [Candidatus Phytoplasma stylosanthis]MDV3168131.1 ribosome recycling factor [Candidatus Phytoplasma stylosanthis]MDV3171100.1 ribosome recycling factor [Candidatus Phytoplasma stylosanthis]MDV3173829.1 ribosome recycling factor [Candidatus Phytoplasma stylosanthis]MDV3174324.1 ribosome recycling factor [Candidatus Phytoplasma stylosanthis]MDV3202643.1 ribosome recycling factor [Candidatus Phytoplasma stylosanthis]